MKSLTRRPLAIMYDLDNTILTFDSASDSAWAEIARDYSKGKSFSFEQMLSAIVRAKREYWADPVRHKWGREHIKLARREVLILAMSYLGETDRESIFAAADEYTRLQNEYVKLFDGAYEAIESVKKGGIKTALITNGSAEGQRAKIERFKLAPLFDTIIIDSEVGVSKPDERIYSLALERLGAAAADAAMIGDKPEWDTETPQRMGIFSVWCNWKNETPDKPIAADLYVKSVAELSEIILALPMREK